MKLKVCRHCNKRMDISNFAKIGFPKIGHRGKCKNCCKKDHHVSKGAAWSKKVMLDLRLGGSEY